MNFHRNCVYIHEFHKNCIYVHEFRRNCVYIHEYHRNCVNIHMLHMSPRKLLCGEFSTSYTPFCWVCTINSELTYFPICTTMG